MTMMFSSVGGGSLGYKKQIKGIKKSFSPLDVPNLVLWLDASDQTKINFGINPSVSQWDDKSGKNNHAVQPTMINQPTFVTNVQNSKPIIRFDGIQNTMFVQNLTLPTKMSIFIACKLQDSLNKPFLIEHDTATSLNEFFFYFGNAQLYREKRNGLVHDSTNIFPWSSSNFSQFSHIYNDGFNLRQNKLDVPLGISAGVPVPNTNHTSNLYIASRTQTSIFGAVDLGEILIYTRSITSSERDSIENYLSAKWGI